MKTSVLTILAVVFLMGSAIAQSSSKIPLIGSKAPSFMANSTNGKMEFPNDFGKNWKILFSHPQDFTPVCSSELLELAYLQSDFDKLGVKIAVISTDDVEQHDMWAAHLEEIDYKGRGTQEINFPIFDDHKKTASKLYGMLHEPTSSTKDVRGVFVIDPDNVVRSVNFYPMQVGRNMNEFIRLIEALQTVDEAKVITPANWEKGDDVMVPYYPYTKAQLEANPELKDEYYSMGNRMWFKKVNE
ncbi:MAG TPA: redoxin domain-containing protein [Draconibacterium sp.]|nr:redoxin domain-containing protein [Draconibacterium sp.]